jgi:nicotinamide mononucleotide transporter
MTTTTITPITRPGPTKDIIVSAIIAVVATGLSYIIGHYAGWFDTLNLIEVGAVFTSYMSTWLCVVQRRFNYPMGIVSSVLYAWLFFDASLVASAVVNVYLVFYLFYGFYRWRNDDNTRPVTLVAGRWWPAYVVGTVAAYFAVYAVARAFGGSFLWTDSLILILTILAQVMLDNKKLENWLVWLIMDVFATYEYFNTHLYLVGFQYVLFTINTVIGGVSWYRAYKRQGKVDTRGGTSFAVGFDEMDHMVAKGGVPATFPLGVK